MKGLFFAIVLLFLGGNIYGQLTMNGKTYRTVKIGDQTWMAENLDVTTYKNGDSIPQVQDPKQWSALKSGAWCYYENRNENGSRFGKLYNWYAVSDPRGLAPQGWHIPTDAEWTQLATAIGGRVGSAPKMKTPKGWTSNGGGTNETGFAALPAGTRSVELFSFAGNYGYWWSSTEFDSYSAWNRFLGYNNDDMGRSTGWKQFGNSVRCLKDGAESSILLSKPAGNKKDSVTTRDTLLASPVAESVSSLTIGSQVWTAQNLDVAFFQNGDAIAEAKTPSEWTKSGELKQPAWCYYNNDSTKKAYGRLYNWYAVNDSRGLAPRGWHIPTEAEWTKMIDELGSDGGGAKIKSVSGWKDKGNGSNETGFDAIPCGFRTSDGIFYNETVGSYWWGLPESSPATGYYHSTTYFGDAINSDVSGDKAKGLSIRCIKN